MPEEFTPLPPAPPEQPPFVGIMKRLLAFVLDIALLYLFTRLAERSARPALLNLNPFLPWLGFLITFLYFALGNSRLTGGRTVGKVVMHFQTVDASGLPVSVGRAMLRALVQGLAMPPLLRPDPYLASLILPTSAQPTFAAGFMLLLVVSISTLLTLFLSVGLHPYKRGWHDMAGGTYVTFSPEPDTFKMVLNNPPESLAATRIRFYPLVTIAFLLISALALVIFPAKAIFAPEIVHMAKQITPLNQQLDFSPYTIVNVSTAEPGFRKELLQNVARLRAQQADRAKQQATPTTDTAVQTTATILASYDYDGVTNLAVLYRAHGPFDPADINSDAFHQKTEKLRAALWDSQQVTTAGTRRAPTAERFLMFLYEPCQLTFNNETKLRARITGPANPQGGPLEIKTIDQTTTSTTP